MGFSINDLEIEALHGLPHLQQIVYLRGIRPYMNYANGIVGIPRGISHLSISEECYVEPWPGRKAFKPSRMQVRRAIVALEQVGLVAIRSTDKKLILQCLLATTDISARKKPDTLATHSVASSLASKSFRTPAHFTNFNNIDDNSYSQKADTPPEDCNINTLSLDDERKVLIPENFQPSGKVINVAKRDGCPAAESPEQLNRFIAYHRSRGTRSFDWNAEYSRWLYRAKDFHRKGEKNGRSCASSSKSNSKKYQTAVDRVRNAHKEYFPEKRGSLIEYEENNGQRYHVVVDEHD